MRWTKNDREEIRCIYLEMRRANKTPKEIYTAIALRFNQSYRSIKSLIERLRQSDPDLLRYKSRHWTRDDILDEIATRYVSGNSMNRVAFPPALKAIIENHIPPKSIRYGLYFTSFDNAVAEAILKVGYKRSSSGLTDKRILSLSDAKSYYRRALKQSHNWTSKDVINIFKDAYNKDLPVTPVFFEKYSPVYQRVLGLNRTLKGFRQTVERHYPSWYHGMLVAGILDPVFYGSDGKLRFSTEETIVGQFLRKHGILFIRGSERNPIVVDSQPLIDRGYTHFVPDFYLLNKKGNITGIVEVFGSVQDSEAASGILSLLYKDKMDAKRKFYQEKFPRGSYIAIVHSDDRSDLLSLREKFGAFLSQPLLDKFAKEIRSDLRKGLSSQDLARVREAMQQLDVPIDKYSLPYVYLKEVDTKGPLLSLVKGKATVYIPKGRAQVSDLIKLYKSYINLLVKDKILT